MQRKKQDKTKKIGILLKDKLFELFQDYCYITFDQKCCS